MTRLINALSNELAPKLVTTALLLGTLALSGCQTWLPSHQLSVSSDSYEVVLPMPLNEAGLRSLARQLPAANNLSIVVYSAAPLSAEARRGIATKLSQNLPLSEPPQWQLDQNIDHKRLRLELESYRAYVKAAAASAGAGQAGCYAPKQAVKNIDAQLFSAYSLRSRGQFGCASSQNLAATVANDRHLIQAESLSPASAEQARSALGRYHRRDAYRPVTERGVAEISSASELSGEQ